MTDGCSHWEATYSLTTYEATSILAIGRAYNKITTWDHDMSTRAKTMGLKLSEDASI